MTATNDEVVAPAPRASRFIGLGIGCFALVLGLLPRILGGMQLSEPDPYLGGPRPMPELPVSLLPLRYEHWLLAFVFLGSASLFAALVARRVKRVPRPSRRFVFVGLAVAQGAALVQSAVAFAEARELSRVFAELSWREVFTPSVLSILVSLGFCWILLSVSRTVTMLGILVAAWCVSVWTGLLLVNVAQLFEEGTMIILVVVLGLGGFGFLAPLVLPAAIVGAGLGWYGYKPDRKLWMWAVSVLSVMLVPAVIATTDGEFPAFDELAGVLQDTLKAAAYLLPAGFVTVAVAAYVAAVREKPSLPSEGSDPETDPELDAPSS